jgi:hypothetical protein
MPGERDQHVEKPQSMVEADAANGEPAETAEEARRRPGGADEPAGHEHGADDSTEHHGA